MCNLGILAGLAASLLLCPSPAAAQEVYRNVSSEKLEALLKDMNISARKVASKNDGIFYYYFKQDNLRTSPAQLQRQGPVDRLHFHRTS